jgi:glucokinase
MLLVADIGGTNSRLALVDDGLILPDTRASAVNARYQSFEDMLSAYLAAQAGQAGRQRIEGAAVAVAGPVRGAHAHLTNRDWTIRCDALAAATGAARVRLLNDLAALGLALPGLAHWGGDSLLRAAVPPVARRAEGQMLVVGLGTGVNVCAVLAVPDRPVMCLEAEAGHVALPAPVAATLHDALGPAAASFATTEELFAGPGLARLHAALTGRMETGAAITAAARAGDAASAATVALFSRLLGMWLRDLVLYYLPRGGLWIAGSVARGIFGPGERGGPERAALAAGLSAAGPFGDLVEAVDVRLVTDDDAALAGCIAALD